MLLNNCIKYLVFSMTLLAVPNPFLYGTLQTKTTTLDKSTLPKEIIKKIIEYYLRSLDLTDFDTIRESLPRLFDGFKNKSIQDFIITTLYDLYCERFKNTADVPTKLILACAATKNPFATLWIENYPNVKSEIDQKACDTTPLLEVAETNSLPTMRLLLDANPNIDATDNQGFTALHLAAELNNYKIAQLLLHRGANTEIAETKNGAYPLHTAIQNINVPMVKLLLYYKADPNKTAHWSFTPFITTLFCFKDMQTKNEHTAIKKIIELLLQQPTLNPSKSVPPGTNPLNFAQKHLNKEDLNTLNKIIKRSNPGKKYC